MGISGGNFNFSIVNEPLYEIFLRYGYISALKNDGSIYDCIEDNCNSLKIPYSGSISEWFADNLEKQPEYFLQYGLMGSDSNTDINLVALIDELRKKAPVVDAETEEADFMVSNYNGANCTGFFSKESRRNGKILTMSLDESGWDLDRHEDYPIYQCLSWGIDEDIYKDAMEFAYVRKDPYYDGECNINEIEEDDYNLFVKCGLVCVPSNIEKISEDVLVDDVKLIVHPNNPFFSYVDDVLFSSDNKELVFYPRDSERTEYTVPGDVKIIGAGAFAYCKNLRAIILPDGLEVVREAAIWNCDNLKKIYIPNTVKQICRYAINSKGLGGIIIAGKRGSIAETYSRDYCFPFEAIEE